DGDRQTGEQAAFADGPLEQGIGMAARALEAQGRQRVDRRIDGGDALLQRVEQVVRRELLPTQPIHDRARIGTPQLAIHGSPPVAPSPPTDWHESYACVKKGPRRGSAIPPAQTKTAPDKTGAVRTDQLVSPTGWCSASRPCAGWWANRPPWGAAPPPARRSWRGCRDRSRPRWSGGCSPTRW